MSTVVASRKPIAIASPGPTAIVVGGGVSGVGAAWYLRQAGWQVTIVEANDRLGGRAASSMLDGREVTLGGKNLGRRYCRMRELVAAHGPASYEPFGVNSARITSHGLRTVDSTRRVHSALRLMQENAPRDVARLGAWVLRVASSERDRWADSPLFERLARRRGDPMLADVLGPRALATVVRPLTVRMNGAEPSEALLSAFGSNLGTLLDTFDQLTEGLGQVFDRFAATIDCRLSRTAVAMRAVDGGREVEVARPGGERDALRADAVVLALPASAAAPLVAEEDPALASALRAVRYFPARTVVAEYDRPVFTPQVRAIVFGADSALSNAGAYGIDALGTVRYTFSGAYAREQLHREPEDLLDQAEAALAAHTPIGSAKRLHHVTKLWDSAYCGFASAHHELARRLATPVAAGLAMCGDYLSGASMEACLRSAQSAVAGLTVASPVADDLAVEAYTSATGASGRA